MCVCVCVCARARVSFFCKCVCVCVCDLCKCVCASVCVCVCVCVCFGEGGGGERRDWQSGQRETAWALGELCITKAHLFVWLSASSIDICLGRETAYTLG